MDKKRILTIRIITLIIQVGLLAVLFKYFESLKNTLALPLLLWAAIIAWPVADFIFKLPISTRNRRQQDYYNQQDEQTKQAIRRGHFVSQLFIFAGIVLGVYAEFMRLFYQMPPWIKLARPDALYFLLPYSEAFIGILWFMTGTAIGYVLAIPAARIAAGKAYQRQWRAYTSIKPIFPRLFSKLLLLAVVLAVATQSTFLLVTRNGIELKNYWGLTGKTYNWNQVKSVDKGSSSYTINFADSYKWTSDINYTSEKAADYISEQAKKAAK